MRTRRLDPAERSYDLCAQLRKTQLCKRGRTIKQGGGLNTRLCLFELSDRIGIPIRGLNAGFADLGDSKIESFLLCILGAPLEGGLRY
jgi:hypothetical protein